jgi:hypothetical protein
MVDANDLNGRGWFVDSVDQAVGAAPGDHIPAQLSEQGLSNLIRVLQ